MARDDIGNVGKEQLDAIGETMAPRLSVLNSRTEKTREAAATLFFTYGIYPSAQKVHAVTRHGSLSDINDDLRQFWQDLRSRAKVQLDLPEFPREIGEAFSESLRQVWELANQRANQALDGARAEARQEVDAAQEQLRMANERHAMAVGQAESLQANLDEERRLRVVLERQVEGLKVEVQMLGEQAAIWKSQAEEEGAKLLRSEQRFVDEIAQERSARQRDNELFSNEMNFAKLQIDRARQDLKDFQANTSQERQRANAEIVTYRQRIQVLEDELLATNQKLRAAKAEAQLARTSPAAAGVVTQRALPKRKGLRKNSRTIG